MANKDEKMKFKDFIEYESQMVVFLNEEQTKLTNKYNEIFRALREKKQMTAKEIHDLYIDEETQKHIYTIKTIYRYLERLEESGLIQVAGHRLTEGQRLTEKLYARTANIFFKAEKEKVHPEAIKYRKDRLKDIYTFMSEVERKPIIDYQEFEELFMRKIELEQQMLRSLTSKIPKNETLTKLFSSMDIDSINYVNDTTAMLLVLVQHPEIYTKLQEIFKK
ncbi:MAG: transcriptional repressor [Candidatus Thorarchaeota archaeon]